MKSIRVLIAIVTALCFFAVGAMATVPNYINYQGTLTDDNGDPITGTRTIQFLLYADSVGGFDFWNEVHWTVNITNGLFHVQLGGFQDTTFNGEVRWLEMVIEGETFTPRTSFVSVPYAYKSESSDQATMAESANHATYSDTATWALGGVGGTSSDTVTFAWWADSANWADSAFHAVYSDTTDQAYHAMEADSATHAVHADTAEYAMTGAGGTGWSLTGNSGTDPAINFLGTNDSIALELRINNLRTLRIEPAYHYAYGFSPNIVVGYNGNVITAGAVGVTISGGGRNDAANLATDDFCTIGGGMENQAGDNAGITNDSTHATVGGGFGNRASGMYSTIAGGVFNTATHFSAAVSGGQNNNAIAGYSFVGGGSSNEASNWFASVCGGNNNDASDSYATVGGGRSNEATSDYSTIAGGRSNDAFGEYSFLGGGVFNEANGYCSSTCGGDHVSSSGAYAFAGGGYYNSSDGWCSTVCGGQYNRAQGNCSFAAGRQARADHNGSFVWADSADEWFSSTDENQFLIRASGGVGIGTNSPEEQLDVNGTVKMTGFKLPTGAANGYILTSDGSGVGAWNAPTGGGGGIGGNGTANYIPKFTGTTTIGNSSIYQSGSYVGIGTTSPSRTFDVNGRGIFENSSTQDILRITNIGSGKAIYATTNTSIDGTPAIEGVALTSTGETIGVKGVSHSDDDDAIGVLGEVTGSSGNTFGVKGISHSHTINSTGSTAGVFGLSTATGSVGDVFGVLGEIRGAGGESPGPNFAAGVYGVSYATSGLSAGVWGDSWSSDPNGAGLVGKNNSYTGNTRGAWGEVNSPSGVGIYGRNASSSTGTKAAHFETARGDYADVAYWNGSTAYGILSNGVKSTVMTTTKGDVALFCPESPEVWFEDFGEGQLTNGSAHIDLDQLFLETITIDAQHPMKVFVQLNDDCNGVLVKRGNTGFDVIELQDGKSNAKFTYRVVAKRKGYENSRLEAVYQEISSR